MPAVALARDLPRPRCWFGEQAPLNDLDEAQSETELDDGDTLPEEVLEQLQKQAPPPDPIPDPGVM